MNHEHTQDQSAEEEYFAEHAYPEYHSEPLYSLTHSQQSWGVYPGPATGRPLPYKEMDKETLSYGEEENHPTQSFNLMNASGEGNYDFVPYSDETVVASSKTNTWDSPVLCGWESLKPTTAPTPTLEEQEEDDHYDCQAIHDWAPPPHQVDRIDHVPSTIATDEVLDFDGEGINFRAPSLGHEVRQDSLAIDVGTRWYTATGIATASIDQLKDIRRHVIAVSKCIKDMEKEIDQAKEHTPDWLGAEPELREAISYWRSVDTKFDTNRLGKWAVDRLCDTQEELTVKNRMVHMSLLQASLPYLRDKHYERPGPVEAITNCTCWEHYY
ncbi:hypothetical protein M231_07504 [Tremella mesenterica]|uniref:Uncharacterized protein n=1 Tax=Tremella mesenterica TaxID=5217 RepID=A0A4V1M311_TREME|nr:uncharacterized protein TREMEDRAFT_64870 [Tremella mesenterica DSM 1558]EIW67004.1 hypothetical protein TREMEDRAFT_64870 [Tremella mesenterica DSM 1558]RXK35250.1 hypothetical protein M231_07504 [Tremella mesenterica]